MRNFNSLFSFDIQLFADGGGAGAGSAGAATGATGANAAAAGQQTSGEASAAAGQNSEAAANNDERAAKYRELVKGEFKDLYDADVQGIIKSRFKSTDAKLESFDKATKALERVFAKYGVENSDFDALSAALDADDSLWEEEAFERGLTVEQLKGIKKIESQNRELLAREEQRRKQEAASRVSELWKEQAKATQKIYPKFNLQTELKDNPQFRELLNNGVTVQAAFEVTHLDDILSAGMQMAASEAERKVSNSIAARGRRPTESGVSSQSGAVHKVDVNNMTKAQRQEIIRRVRNGEKITFP